MTRLDHELQARLLQRRGDNRPLAQALIETLSEENKRRLLHLLEDMESEIQQERRKARRFGGP